MAKQNLLLVDADLRSVRVLEVSLRKAGYNVASAGTARDALGMLELSRPDLVLCDTRLPTMDGFQLIQEMRSRPELAGIPLMILSSDVSVETKVRGLELGVEDYLTKPIYIKELLARVNIVLQRKRREGIERLDQGHKRKFSGSLSDMGVVDLLQAIDHNKKSGVLYLTSGNFDGAIYFCNGAPVDAAVGTLRGSRAIYRTLLWTEGTFEIDFREIDREDHVQSSMQAVLMEGLRRVDEWGRLLEQLPNLDTVFDVSDTQLMARLAEIPDEINSVLREFDGRRSLWEIVDACDSDDLETLNAVSKLYFEGLLYNTGRRSGEVDPIEDEPEPLPELSDMALPHISSGPPVITHTLAPAWPSVPSGDGSESELIDDTLQLNIPATPKLPGGLRITPSEAPKRRKGRKRKKRGGQSLPADAIRKPAKASKAKAEEPEVLEVDESVAEITPSTIAPPPEEAENAALVQAERADTPATSTPPQLPHSRPTAVVGATSMPPELPRASQAAAHDNPTLDLSPVRSPAMASARPPLNAAEGDTAAPQLASTTPPPLGAEADTARFATEPPRETQDLHSDDETTETQVSLRGSIPPPGVESYVPRKAASPPPLPYVSKPPSPGFGSHRGVTSPGFAAAPVDEETLAAAAAAISEAETAPPPLAASVDPAPIPVRTGMRSMDARIAGADVSIPPALRGKSYAAPFDAQGDEGASTRGTSSAASRAPDAEAAWQRVSQRPHALDPEAESSESPASSVTETSPAPYPGSIPARDFEAAILAASVAPPEPRSEEEIGLPLAAGEAAESGASARPSGLAEPRVASASEPSGVIEDAGAQVAPEGEPLEADAPGAEALSALPSAAASAGDEATSDSPEGSADASRVRSVPPLAAASAVPGQRADSGVAELDEKAGEVSDRARDVSVPPLAAASAVPGQRADSDVAELEEAGDVSDRARDVVEPPLAVASVVPGQRADSGVAELDEEAGDVSDRARDVAEPPLSAASTPPTEGFAAQDDAAGVASELPRAGSAPPLAAASAPPGQRVGLDSDASADRSRDGSELPPAAASVPAMQRADSEAFAALDDGAGVASDRARDVSVPPLAAASVPPLQRADSEGSAATDAGSSEVADRPLDVSAPPLAAASVVPGQRGGLDLDTSADHARDGSEAPPAGASSVPAVERGDLEAFAAPAEEGGDVSERAPDVGEPRLASAAPREGFAAQDDAAGVASELPRAGSAPPLAAASAPPGQGVGWDSNAIADRARDGSEVPPAAASVSAVQRGDSEAFASLDDGDGDVSGRTRDGSVPPLAAASTPPMEGIAARDEGDGDVLGRARDGSVPPLAAASTPPMEGIAARDEGDGDVSGRVRNESVPPLAAASAPPRIVRESVSAGVEDGSGMAALAAGSELPSAPESSGDVANDEAELVERSFAVPPLAAPSVPAHAVVDDERLGEAGLSALDSAAPANDVAVSLSDSAKPEEDFSDLEIADQRPSLRSAAGSSRERASPPPLPAAGPRSTAPHLHASPPPLPHTRGRDDAETRQYGSPPPLATATDPPPRAAALSSLLPPSVETHTAPGGYVAINPDSLDSLVEENSKRVRAPLHRTAVPPPFTPTAEQPPSAISGGESGAAAEDEPRHSVVMATNSTPPRISTVTSSVRPHGATTTELDQDDASTAEYRDGGSRSREVNHEAAVLAANDNHDAADWRGADALTEEVQRGGEPTAAMQQDDAEAQRDGGDLSPSPLRAGPDARTQAPRGDEGSTQRLDAEAAADDAQSGKGRAAAKQRTDTDAFADDARSGQSRPAAKQSDDIDAFANEAQSGTGRTAAKQRIDADAFADDARSDPSRPAAKQSDDIDAFANEAQSGKGRAAAKQRTDTGAFADDGRSDQSRLAAKLRDDVEHDPSAGDRAAAQRRDDVDVSAAAASDASGSESTKDGSQRAPNMSNVISFVPRKRADDARSGAPAAANQSMSSLPARSPDQGVWGNTSTAPGNRTGAPSQAAPEQKRRMSRWVQAGGAAATVALAAGLFALRARDTAPQGSLISAVPEVVDTPAVSPPSAAAPAKEQALGELEALHQQAQALPGTPQAPSAPQPAEKPAPAQAAPATPTTNAELAEQRDAPSDPAKAPTAPAEQQDATQVLAKGRSLEQRGKKQDAINLYAKAVEEGHASSQLLSRMAFLYLNQGKNALAETAAQRAADADETNSEAWIVLGAAQDGLGKKQAAEQAYRSCAQKGQGQYVTECKRMLR